MLLQEESCHLNLVDVKNLSQHMNLELVESSSSPRYGFLSDFLQVLQRGSPTRNFDIERGKFCPPRKYKNIAALHDEDRYVYWGNMNSM